MIAPCKDCTDRIVGCHSTCPRYIEWHQWNEERKVKERKEQQDMQMLNEYSFSFPAGKRHNRRR